MSRNVLCDRVMASDDIYPNLLHSHYCQCRPNGWVHPCPILLMFGSRARHPPRRPVVKPIKGFLQSGGGQYPRLGIKQKHFLHHRHIKPPGRSPIQSLPYRYHLQPSPFYPRPLEVPFHRRPVVVEGQQRASQVPERRDLCRHCPICQEDPTHLFLRLLNNQPPSLPIRLAPAHRWSWVRPIECLLWGKYVTLGAPGVGLILFLQDYYSVPRVLVRKVHPEVRPLVHFPSASLHREPQLGKYSQKGHPILC